MKKKIIGILIITLLVLTFVVNHLITYANFANNEDDVLSIGITATNTSGVGYSDGKPADGGDYIWNVTTYDSTDDGYVIGEQRNLYCVNADYGDTWFDKAEEEKILDYKLYYDIENETDINALKSVLGDATDDGIEGLFTEKTQEQEITYEFSKELLWLFDNLYITDVSVLDEYLAKVGIVEVEYDNSIYYETTDGTYLGTEKLTESDIIAIQRMAIWYFTDGIDKTGTNNTAWLFMDKSDGEGYKTLSQSRNDMAMYLYNYLIDDEGTKVSQYQGGNRVIVNTIGLQNENDKFILQTKKVNDKYITGPIIIEKENDNPIDVSLAVTNSLGNVSYKITEADGTEITDATIESVVGKDGGFYISTDVIDELNIAVTVTPTTATKTLWLVGNETNGIISIAGEQPIIEINKKPEVTNFTVKPFDLALRKYITAVNNQPLTQNTRVPNIVLDSLNTGTTATYNHRKDPVVVEEYAEVTYQITIYNEGSKAGYASKIIDQLPTGLISSTSNSSVVTSKGPDGDRNQYKLEYSPTNNQIILTLIQWPEELEQEPLENGESYVRALNSYQIGNLDYETIEIKCIVAQKADTQSDLVLTNVAWIAEAYDAETNKLISTEGTLDRDSEPQLIPTIDADDMSDYRGSTAGNELSNSEFFYAGQQDDDDFEKVVIKPVKKKFDLALVKFITAISDDQTIEENEYLKEADGTYSREPEVKIDQATGKIVYDFTNRGAKNPLIVEPGDYVLYTIRVYNEGELDGYVNLIKDELPEGLEFVSTNVQYNGIWDIDENTLYEDGRQEITTDWYAQGNTYGTLLKAFDKTSALSKQNPDYLDAQVLCQVAKQIESERVLVNYAQISADSDDDIDSTPDVWVDDENHKDDDQDIEKVKVEYFDLSLRKFITAIGNKEITDREPVVDLTKLLNGKSTTATYNHTKKPILVQVGDKIVYTIRVYNEGSKNGFASEVTDYLPKYLTYVKDSQINKDYGWQISEDGRIATTTYLSNKELKAFDDKVENPALDYADLKIECEVMQNIPSTQNQTNIAEITEYTCDGVITKNDIDSISDNVEDKIPADEKLPSYKNDELDKQYVPGNEDDDDFEKVYVKYFDLSLLKFVTKVIVVEDGKQTITETGYNGLENPEPVVKVELHKKKLDKVIVKFGYGITITNEGDVAGYATEITDYIPEGLTFDPTDNPEWMDEGNNVISTRQLEEVLLQPGESRTIEVILTWINGADNLALKTNTAEISEDKNEYDIPDRDSTPDNKIDGEDDIDIAKVILAISTGATKTYFMLTIGLLAVVLVGVALIKRFVL